MKFADFVPFDAMSFTIEDDGKAFASTVIRLCGSLY